MMLAAAAVYLAFKRQHTQRIGPVMVAGRPTILYFGSDNCAACPTQAHYLAQVDGEWHGRVTIQKIDAEHEPEKASQYHVFTLPTTILVDAVGQVREINYGLTNSYKLSKQVASIQSRGETVGREVSH